MTKAKAVSQPKASKLNSRRKKLSLPQKHDVLMEAGYRCGNPRCPIILAVHILEDHHIVRVSEGGGNQVSNLLALCPNCHTLYHRGDINREAIRHWKGLLLALNYAFDRRGMELLRFLYQTKDNPVPLWFSADGVLQFANLIATGLMKLGEQNTGTPWQIPESRHQVLLSERGVLLIEAWLAGDEKKYLGLIKATGGS